MLIAAWNVNSLKARLEHLTLWLQQAKPDVVLLQELKCPDDQFPAEAIESEGYQALWHGQKSYNGVAILARNGLKTTLRCKGIPNFADDAARYIEADINGIQVASIYVPNGQEPDCDKYTYKMHFYSALQQYLAKKLQEEVPYILGGDFNVSHQPIDVHQPPAKQRILYSDAERAAFRQLLHMGYTDSYRLLHPTTPGYSWWDYREGRFVRNEGWRIDYLLCSPQAADMLQQSSIDCAPRGWEKPSDHTPVLCKIQPTLNSLSI